jgi:glucose-6-phosphate-specific signal transduction histidine kinase
MRLRCSPGTEPTAHRSGSPNEYLEVSSRRRFEARLNFNRKELRLELEDDGEGFTTTNRHDGFGLIGMRERLEQMGGTLTVTTAHNEGTKIIVVFRYAS